MPAMKRIALALLLLGACKKDRSIAKIDDWDIEGTTLEQAQKKGQCHEDELPDGRAGSYCFALPPLGISGMQIAVDAYFAGTEPSSKLVEMQLSADACNQEAFLTWMRTNFGTPFDDHDTRHAWKNAHMIILGSLPLRDNPARCVVRFLPPREQALFDYYWDKVKAQ